MICNHCKEDKDIKDFYKNQLRCKVCSIWFSQRYRNNNKDKIRDYDYYYKYGITTKEVEKMQAAQNDRCVICKNKFKHRRDMHLDHDHITGKTRQLLCNNCNGGIGLLQDDIEIVASALKYLRKWK